MSEPADKIEALFWRDTHDAISASKASGHAWVEFKRDDGSVTVLVNDIPALRFSIRYRESGPFIFVEQAPGTSESMGDCLRTAGMVKHYVEILEAHNVLGDHLHAARSFLISDEQREAARTAISSAD